MELLGDLAVQFQLLLLERWNNFVTNVNGQKIFQIACGDYVAFCLFDCAGKATSVTLTLEKCAHGLFSGVKVIQVLLA